MEPIIYILANRQLVYYYESGANQPYSFIGADGKNTITIRTRTAEYTIKDVELKQGEKLEFSFDKKAYKNSAWKDEISKRRMPKRLTKEEQTFLERSFFVLSCQRFSHQAENIVVRQGNLIYHATSRNGNLIFGPLKKGEIDIQIQNRFKDTILWQPSQKYVLRENYLSFVKVPHKRKFDHLLPQLWYYQHSPGELILTPEEEELLRPDLFKDHRHHYLRNSKNNGVFLTDLSETDQLRCMVLEREDEVVALSPPRLKYDRLPSGNYHLTLLRFDGSFTEVEFFLEQNAALFVNLKNVKFEKDDSQSILKNLLSVNPGLQNVPMSEFEKALILDEKYRSTHQLIRRQSGQISGYVYDSEGTPLIGANVIVKGTTIGAVTDFDGKYELFVPFGYDKVVISYTGYQTEEVKLTNGAKQNLITMKEGYHLNEVVVAGYGGRRRKSRKTAAVNIRGSRSYTVPLIDGVKVGEGYVEAMDLIQLSSPRSNFKDYAYWHPNLLTDQNGEAYFNVTFPDDITQWENYIVGMNAAQQAGMTITETNAIKEQFGQLKMPRFLIEGDQVDLLGKALNYGNDTLVAKSQFVVGSDTLAQTSFSLSKIAIQKAAVTAPLADSLTVQFDLMAGGIYDGERRSIPILPKGTEEKTGVFHLLEKDSVLTLNFPKEKGAVYLRAEINELEILKPGIQYLTNYRHLCNEQLASKIIALLWSEKLADLIGQRFKQKQLLKKLIRKLEKRQNYEGYWSWWTGETPEHWMSRHVIRALAMAKKEGYKVRRLDRALTWFTFEIDDFSPATQIAYMNLLMELNETFDYKETLRDFEEEGVKLSMNSELLVIKMKQQLGLPYDLKKWESKMKSTLFGGYYLGKEPSEEYWYNNELTNNLLAYEIFKNAGEKEIAKGIRSFILRKRSKGYWMNTITTAKILNVLMPDFLSIQSNEKISTLTIAQDNESSSITDFPFTNTYQPNQPIQIQQTGSRPLYLTAYQKHWNSTPEPKRELFDIKTIFKQNNKSITQLTMGKKTELQVSVQVHKAAEYVVIEVPIPAGCSYGKKRHAFFNYKNHEVHREYFKDRVAIYCRHLPVGTYDFLINLEPGYTGTFTMNPARAEAMYFPVFDGQGEGAEVEIKNIQYPSTE